MNRKWPILVLSLILLVPTAHAKFKGPTYAPVDRLITNTERFIKKHPKDAGAHYTLARIHYLAFVNKANRVGITGEKTPPEVAPDWLLDWGPGNFLSQIRRQHARKLLLEERGYESISDLPKTKWNKFYQELTKKRKKLKKQGWPKSLSKKKVLAHASSAAQNFKKAIQLKPGKGLYHLGVASLHRQFLQYSAKKDIEEWPEAFRNLTRQKAINRYYRAYKLSIEEALELEDKPAAGLGSIVAYEAGNKYLSLTENKDSLSDQKKERRETVQEHIRQLKHLPRGPITPIVFSFCNNTGLEDLIATGQEVTFDLDGNGVAERWPWVKPKTGFLAWDPEDTGRIESGRQLFGTGTWWILFRHGYSPLRALDDDGDGRLNGPELDGIVVWFDRNSNGESERGEVKPATEVGIAAISTDHRTSTNGLRLNRKGLKLQNGETVPTYDWTPSPAGGTSKVSLTRR